MTAPPMPAPATYLDEVAAVSEDAEHQLTSLGGLTSSRDEGIGANCVSA